MPSFVNIPWIFLIWLQVYYSVYGNKHGYLSFCDLYSGPADWQKNSGYQIYSWLRSVVPFPNPDPDSSSRADFISNTDYISLLNINSSSGLTWKAFGDFVFDGWLYGQTDSNGNFLKGESLYIYPDGIIGILGTFENDDILIEGQLTKISHYRCSDGIMELKFDKPNKYSRVYKYKMPSIDSLSLTPMIRDPYEEKNVYTAPNVDIPELANEDSLFVKKNIPAHVVVAYYNGYYRAKEDPIPSSYPSFELFHKNLVSVNDTHSMNIPYESSFLENYVATLGHKINHHFEKNNVVFVQCKHPLYGKIYCLVSKKEMKKGEEIFLDYGYSVTSEDSPQWYKNNFYRMKMNVIKRQHSNNKA